ncbi:hypothetical protein VISI1226_20959 [Vibrio sinaloensis DSM 21326]|uniref:DUF3306 domain-containing protein n=1 Tax=Vibrio sinaloensis DSM 21326 TaxID=945550 RepID=E8MAR9_PHOS4|nr:DUF3306 domain-containing protein [Vibrio sinaloensis]EGA68914.1 hypothetical protein VISI1226_20959 [Vibrio sinaloensis DSM 21326]
MATSFLSRWSQRKLEQDTDADTVSEQSDTEAQEPEVLTQQEPIELEGHIDSQDIENEPSVASLLASEVESSVKKAALRKLFLSGEFSEVDRLNDYDHDYQSVKSLSSEVAGKLRDWLNQEESETEESNVPEAVDSNSMDPETENTPVEDDQSEVGQNIPHNN